MKFKYLFAIMSPRNIPEVRQPIVDLLYGKHDCIWFKYYPELEAYNKAREFFLNSPKNYDYFVILPDDMIINDKINLLMDELENPRIPLEGYGGIYPSLAGVTNISYINLSERAKISASGVVINHPGFPDRPSILYREYIPEEDLKKLPDIVQCLFVGFSCQFIARPLLKHIQFRYDNESRPTQGVDYFFAKDLERLDIPQYIHTRCFFTHLRGLSVQFKASISTNPDIIYSGMKGYKKHIIFVDSDKQQ